MQEELRAADVPTKNTADDLKASIVTQATTSAELLDKSIQMDVVSEDEEMVDLDGDGIPDVIIEITDMGIVEQDEFRFEPQEGDKLEFYNERRKYKLDLAASNKAALSLLKQSTQTLIEQKESGKPVTLKTKIEEQTKAKVE